MYPIGVCMYDIFPVRVRTTLHTPTTKKIEHTVRVRVLVCYSFT